MKESIVLEKLAKDNPDKIEEYWVESENGHFLYLVDGYKCSYTDCRTIRENTVKDVLDAFKCIIITTDKK